jgi:hypothetical protein
LFYSGDAIDASIRQMSRQKGQNLKSSDLFLEFRVRVRAGRVRRHGVNYFRAPSGRIDSLIGLVLFLLM